MKNTKIYCRITTRSKLSFYIVTPENKEYYLFTQNFRTVTYDYFRYGVTIDQALDFSNTRKHPALQKTFEKLPPCIRYLEKEYNFTVLRQTAKKTRKKRKEHFEEYDAA